LRTLIDAVTLGLPISRDPVAVGDYPSWTVKETTLAPLPAVNTLIQGS